MRVYDPDARAASHLARASLSPRSCHARVTQTFCPPQNDRHRNRTRLRLEALEDRWVPDGTPVPGPAPGLDPALLVVTTSDDSNDPTDNVVSLREAIGSANGAGAGSDVRVITFDMTKVGPVISLVSALPAIQSGRNIYIAGPGSSALTVQRSVAANFSIFRIQENAVSVVAGLKLLNGRADVGGGIESKGVLTVTGCEIRNCYATLDGGGIHAQKGTLQVYDSTVNGNTAGDRGGGLYVGRDVAHFRIEDSVVGLNYAGHWGGGMYINLVPDAVVDSVNVTGNITVTAGGGIWCSGQVSLSGSTNINNNVVTDATGGQGGGVYANAGSITLLDITIGYNQATTGDGMYLVTGPFGVIRNPAAGGVTYEGGDTEVSGP